MKYLVLLVFAFAQLAGYSQVKHADAKAIGVDSLRKLIVGEWLKGACSGAEVYNNRFKFYSDNTFKYVLDGTSPNGIETINGRYKIEKDTGRRFVLKLRVVSVTMIKDFTIDAGGDAPNPGIFGFDIAKTKTVPQRDSVYHDHILVFYGHVTMDEGSEFTCPYIQIDMDEKFYKISDNKGYELKQ